MTDAPTKDPHACDKAMVPPLSKVNVDIIAEPNGSGGVKWSHQIKDPGHNNAVR